MGTIAPGKMAMLTVLDGEPFGKDTRVVEVWVDGDRYPVSTRPTHDLRGQWDVTSRG